MASAAGIAVPASRSPCWRSSEAPCPERLYFLKPRSYTVGRARHNDLCLSESSISKVHARIVYEEGNFAIEDQGSLHGVYLDAHPVRSRAPLRPGSRLQLGNVTLKFSALDGQSGTDPRANFPWIEQQKLLLSLVQALNSTLVVSEVLDQVLDAVMRITRAERAFLLLADDGSGGDAARPRRGRVAGVPGDLHLRLARGPQGPLPLENVQGISRSVVRRALETGRMVATGNAAADPSLASSQSVAAMELRTIVCTPLRSPRAARGLLGAIYVDNQESSAPFSPESLEAVDALGRHAALAIENAQLFEREERQLQELRQAQDQLLQSGKLATIGQMSAGIAHELNTPLTYIMGNVELLLVQPMTETQQDMLDAVARGAERIKTLVQRLLAFSRPEQEQPVRLDVNLLVERSLEFCHYQILKAGVHVREAARPRPPRRPRRGQPVRDGADQPDRQRGPGDGRRGPARRRDRGHAGCPDFGHRHRPGHPRRRAGEGLRAVLHDEERHGRDRPRPVAGPDGRRTARRPGGLRHEARRRYDFPYHSPTRRITSASTREAPTVGRGPRRSGTPATPGSSKPSE